MKTSELGFQVAKNLIQQEVDRSGPMDGRDESDVCCEATIRALPIQDPVLLKAHQAVLDDLINGQEVQPIITLAVRAGLHIFYHALRFEAKLTLTELPRLSQERVDIILPRYVSDSSEYDVTLTEEECDALEALRSCLEIESDDPETMSDLIIYPLVVVMRLLEDAREHPQDVATSFDANN